MQQKFFEAKGDIKRHIASGGGGGSKNIGNDLFGLEPSKSLGQQLFYNNNNNKQQNSSNANVIATKNSSGVLVN
uniref:Uncharacterized protein n=1 Tax=Glossina morsitans morsitans TaxID=37546 RepID=A0A1B0FDW0_GLOMM